MSQSRVSTGSCEKGDHTAAAAALDYVLGQGSSERERLEAQHEIAWQTVGTKSAFVAPVKPERLTGVLDLGCGTGVWLRRAAGDAPNALLYGFDLSAAKFSSAHDSGDTSICQGRLLLGTQNALAEWPKQLLGKFDVINCLFFMLWLPKAEWPVLLKHIKLLLKPGGWLQVLDPSFDPAPAIWKDEQSLGAAVWNQSIKAYMASPQTAFGEVTKLPSLLTSLGFKSVQTKKNLSLKLGASQPEKSLREISRTILMPNVAKGREAGICAQPGQELKDGVKFPPMQEEQKWNDLLSELESAFESGAEVPCMAVWAQKKRTWVQSLASRLSAALAKV